MNTEQKISTKQLLTLVFELTKPFRTLFWWSVGLTFFLAAISPVRPELVENATNSYMLMGDKSGLWRFFELYMLVLLLEFVFQYVQTYSAVKLAQEVMVALRKKVFAKLQQFSVRYFDKTPVGALVTRVVSDIEGIGNIFSEGSVVIVGDLLKLVAIFACMLYTDAMLTFWVILPIPLLFWATKIFKNAVKASYTEVRNQVAKINTFVQERLTGMLVVQAFQRQHLEAEKFDQINVAHRNANIKSVFAYSVFFPVVELLSSLSVALLLFYGLNSVSHGAINPNEVGKMMKFMLYIQMLYRPIRQLADRFNTLQMGLINAERVFKLLYQETDLQHASGNLPVKDFKGNIDFNQVYFAYQEPHWILKNVNFSVKQGQIVAFVGATGAGKSTIIHLLSGLYQPQQGSILLDDKDFNSYHLGDLRTKIAVVSQDVFLFSDSIYNNVTFKNNKISKEEVIVAAKAIGAHAFIEKLPNQYDFNVQERGVALSLGQRQMLSFLRAYLHNPTLLILDEATSALDSESEQMIAQATEVLCKNKTAIVIAHRLSTVQKADKIFVLDKGTLIEEGTHAELLACGGYYKRLCDYYFLEEVLVG